MSADHPDVFSGAMGDDDGDAGGDGDWGLPQSFELTDITASGTAATHFDFAQMAGVSSIQAGGLSGSGGFHGTLSGLPMTNLSGLQPRNSYLGGHGVGGGVGVGASTAFQIAGGSVSPSSKKMRLSDGGTIGAAGLGQLYQGSRAANAGLGGLGADGSGSDDGSRSSATGNLLSNLGLPVGFLGGSDGGSEGRGAGGSEGAEGAEGQQTDWFT